MTAWPIRLEQPEEMNLLGHILKSLLEGNLATPSNLPRAKRLEKSDRPIGIQAGQMQVSLLCRPQDWCITRGLDGRATTVVQGDLEAFLDVALGRGFWRPLWQRRLRFRGNALTLLRLLPLVRVLAGPDALGKDDCRAS